MADHPNPRLYRGPDAAYRDDAYGSSGTPVPSANDPLAELARLIGNDSFSANRQAPAAALDHQPHDAYPADGYDYPQPDPNAGYSDQYAPQNFSEPSLQHHTAGYPAYAADPNAQYEAQYHAEPQTHDPHYASQNYGPQDRAYIEQPPAPYADTYRRDASPPLAAPPEFLGQRGFQPAGYGQDAHPAEDYYEEASPKRHRAILMASAAAALVVIGTAGAFGYRALFGSSSSGPPPVIQADATPTKIVSAAPRDNSAGKSIQDRIGDQLNERVVSREEQPADVRPQPRVVFPGPAANNNASQPVAANAMAAGEPKKVRTVAIRPDQAADPDPASPARQPTVAAAGRVANPPAAVAAPAPVRQVAPVAPTAPQSNGPLSLSPDADSAPTAPAARVAARAAPQAAIPAAASVGPGAYVQVSSQRSEGDARASFRALQAKYPSVLGSRSASIQRADLGEKGIYYRAMIGPLGGPDAVELCTSLKAAGGTCVIQKN
jgi:hypothetical protein